MPGTTIPVSKGPNDKRQKYNKEQFHDITQKFYTEVCRKFCAIEIRYHFKFEQPDREARCRLKY